MATAPLEDNRYNLAISALTYGFNCLVLDPRTNKLYNCILSIHEEYINILHLIIAEKVSYLLKLHEIYNITDSEFATETKLKDYGISHYLILYTQSLDTFTFAFKTEHEKELFKIGIILFVREAKLYYDRLNEFDPFKAEAMMTFLEADKDGGNLLDIDEIENILSEMKIMKENDEIMKDIQEINRILYDQQKLKRPTDMTNTELNELGFQYLLRYYSIKEDLVKIFREYCNQYKLQSRNNKVSLVDIVRYNDNPIMSASQLREFYLKVLFEKITEQEAMQIIQSFPVYDAEGKEKTEKQELINFNNFCSLLSRRRNSAFMQEKKELYQKMTLPITDYYISCDFSDYSNSGNDHSTKVNNFEISLKRGVRCLHFHLEENNKREPFISNSGDSPSNLEQILKVISSKGFEFNPFPIFIKFQFNNLTKTALDRTAAIINDVFDDHLYTLPNNYQEMECIPSPEQLKKKVIIMATVNPKLFKGKDKDLSEESQDFFKIVSFFGSKLDFQRKGQIAWNFVNIEDQKLRKLEEVEDQNLSNYTKKLMVKVGPTPSKVTEVNKPSSLYLRLGVQMIGLTFNSINEENYIIQSLFMENGGAKSGFLRKPDWMCLKNPKNLYAKNFDTPLFLLSVKVLSGQNCIMNEIKEEEVFLEMFLVGNKREEDVNKKVVSPPQKSQYYIQFNLESTFTVFCLDLAMIVLLVKGQKTKTILSGRAIPVRHLKQGLHPVYLMGDHFKESLSNYLFLQSEHKQIPKKTSTYLQSRP